MRERSTLEFLKHGDQATEFDTVRMRLDFFGLGGQLIGRSKVVSFIPIRVKEMNGHVRIGDCRLFKVLVDTSLAAFVDALKFDGDSCAALQRFWGLSLLTRVMRFPFNPMILNVILALITGRDVDSIALVVKNLGRVNLGVDLDFEVVGRLARTGL